MRTPVYLVITLFLFTLMKGRSQDSAFTYQGRLNDGTNTATGSFDLTFSLWDAASGPSQVGSLVTKSGMAVSNGLFTTSLDFGAAFFNGNTRWLEISARTNGSASFTTLAPRQKLTATPYALYAPNAGTAFSATSVSPGAVGSSALQSSSVNSDKIVDGSITTADMNLGSFSGLFWKTDGNAGLPANHFVGTIDNQPVELRVNNTRALRLEPSIGTPNLVGGFSGNAIAAGKDAAVIGGGGRAGNVNYAGAELTVIGGGWANTNSGGGAAIGGGYLNRIEDFAFDSVIAGGRGNTIRSNSNAATVSGGNGNIIAIGSSFSTIGGGVLNLIQTNSIYSTVSGGAENVIQDNNTYGTLGGGRQNLIRSNVFSGTVAGGEKNVIGVLSSFTTIGGGIANEISPNANSATIAGGEANTNRALRATIGGGFLNHIEAASWEAALAGGSLNTIRTSSPFSTVSGGRENLIGPNVTAGSIPGGFRNEVNGSYGLAAGRLAKANHNGTFVWADSQAAPFASTATNQFLIRAAGGVGINKNNPAAALDVDGTVRASSGNFSSGGGSGSPQLTVQQSTANEFARLRFNTVGSAVWDITSGPAGVPNLNFYNGSFDVLSLGSTGEVTVPGTLAFGSGLRQMIALSADGDGVGLQEGAFYFRCKEGKEATGFVWYKGGSHEDTGAGSAAELMRLNETGLIVNGTVVGSSDRAMKQNFATVDGREVLEKVAQLPIQTWSYKNDPKTAHIGPVAQDFHATFNVGQNDKTIAMVDADGVALAAIQGLNQKLEETRAENVELKQRLADLEKLVSTFMTTRKSSF